MFRGHVSFREVVYLEVSKIQTVKTYVSDCCGILYIYAILP